MTTKKNSDKLSRSEYMKRWRAENPDYFKTYYKKNSKVICESGKRYRTSKHGKKAIQVYEKTKQRRDQKKKYNDSLQKAKRTLDKLKREGKV